MRWIEAAETASAVLADAAAIVSVGDRENDIYQAFARKPANVDVITRRAQTASWPTAACCSPRRTGSPEQSRLTWP